MAWNTVFLISGWGRESWIGVGAGGFGAEMEEGGEQGQPELMASNDCVMGW